MERGSLGVKVNRHQKQFHPTPLNYNMVSSLIARTPWTSTWPSWRRSEASSLLQSLPSSSATQAASTWRNTVTICCEFHSVGHGWSGTTKEHFAKIAFKNHKHSVNNPYSQFRDEYTLAQILESRPVHDPLTMLQCCPT